MRRTIGGNAQDRRRARRAASRRTSTGELSQADVRAIQDLAAAASGSTGLPLSDQNAAWDAAAAKKGLSDDQMSKAFFWSDGDTQKLPFAANVGGTLTAIWKGVTSAAGAIQGARGGVNIPSGDVAGVKAKIAAYYTKAAAKYQDDAIKPPWEAGESVAATVEALAYAETAEDGDYVAHLAFWAEEFGCTVISVDADTYLVEAGEPSDEAEFFAKALVEASAKTNGMTEEEADELRDLVTIELGGKPTKGTKKDKRLKDNQPDGTPDDESPEQSALDVIEDFAASVKCGCGHAYSEHSGGGGTCSHEDGRGTCRCGEFAYPDSDVAALAAAIVAVRPDLAEFEQEVAKIARRTLLATITAAAGDLVWGPEEGFMDLLCDVSQLLHPGDTDWFEGPYAIDASINLDKVLLSDNGEWYVAPMTIDQTGDPVLSDKTDWVSVEPAGYVETGDKPMKLQVTLRDLELTAAATAEAIPAEHQPDEVIPEASDEITPPTANASGEIPWTATFVPEGKLTEDGRAFAPGAIILPPDEQARQLPLSLMGLIETSAEGGHDRAKVAGRIDSMWRDDSGKVKASGVFSKEEWGQMIARMVGDKELTGLSVDIAPLDWEHVSKNDWFDADGKWTAIQNEEGEWAPADGQAERNPEETLEDFFNGDLVLAITKAVIGMATVCPFPAFGEAEIALTASGIPRTLTMTSDFEFDCGCTPVEIEYGAEPEKDDEPVLTAAAAGLAPVAPPAEWFADPEFEELTPLTITDDGRIFGHAWQWGTCHLSFDKCVTAPQSETNYAYYMLGEIECEDGERLAVGKITLDTSHAGTRLSRQEATSHYDHTGTVAAHVTFGEDEHGGWFSGAISPELSEEKVRLLRGSTVSGDWRGVDGNLELVALLSVNVPGFPVPRSLRASVEMVDDEPVTLSMVAAGIVTSGLEAEIRDLVAEAAEPAEAA